MIIQTRLQQRLARMKMMEFMFPKHVWALYLRQDITEEFFEDILFKLATKSNVSGFTTGDAGQGKSLLTASLLQIMSWFAAQLTGQPITFTVKDNLRSDVTQFINMLSGGKSFHAYQLDEWLDVHGRGSQITVDSMKNIMKASARFEQISWWLVGVELLPLHVYNYVIRAELKDFDETDLEKSKAFVGELYAKIWEDLYGNYMQIGKVTIPAPSNQFIAEYHRLQKAPKVASVLESQGIVEQQGLKDVYDRLYGRKSKQS